MRLDTAAPSFLELGVFVIRFGMLRLAVYALRAFGLSRLILADLGRFWQTFCQNHVCQL